MSFKGSCKVQSLLSLDRELICHHAVAAARSLCVTKRTDKDLNIVYKAHANWSHIVELSVWFSYTSTVICECSRLCSFSLVSGHQRPAPSVVTVTQRLQTTFSYWIQEKLIWKIISHRWLTSCMLISPSIELQRSTTALSNPPEVSRFKVLDIHKSTALDGHFPRPKFQAAGSSSPRLMPVMA